MATAKSIGSLFIDIEARTAKLEADMAKVRRILTDTGKDVKSISNALSEGNSVIETKVARFGVLLLGARSMVQLLAKEFRFVIQNVEDIPGLPPKLVEDIQNMRHDINLARNDVDRFIANLSVGVYHGAQSFGAWLGAEFERVAGRAKEAVEALDEFKNGKRNLSPDDAARDRMSPGAYDREVASAKEVLRERTEAAARAAMDEAHQIIALRDAQGFYFDIVEDGSKTTLEQTHALTKVRSLQNEEASKTESLLHKLASAQELANSASGKAAIATDSLRQRIAAYKDGIFDVNEALAENTVKANFGNADEKTLLLAERIKLTEKLTVLTTALGAAERRYGEEGMLAGKIVADDLGEAILKGEHLDDLLNRLWGDLLKLILQREILGPLADFLGGGFSKFFNLGGHAMGGPVNSPTWVGENGPEIFNPGGAGTIIPADRIGGSGGGNQYFIDATGADPAAIARLERSLLTLAGPGVVERRSVAATLNTVWRNGAAGRAMRG